MPNCDFNKAAKQLFPVNVQYIFRLPLYKNTCVGLLLNVTLFHL